MLMFMSLITKWADKTKTILKSIAHKQIICEMHAVDCGIVKKRQRQDKQWHSEQHRIVPHKMPRTNDERTWARAWILMDRFDFCLFIYLFACFLFSLEKYIKVRLFASAIFPLLFESLAKQSHTHKWN